ncbi:hypothetical protein BST61_g920 [Cercospora zeina]
MCGFRSWGVYISSGASVEQERASEHSSKHWLETGSRLSSSYPQLSVEGLVGQAGHGFPDLDVPCNAVSAIQAQCMYGIDSNDLWNLSDGNEGVEPNEPPMQSYESQRVCVCESQFWDQLAGCVACYQAHAPDAALRENLPATRLTSASSSYCAASATATIGLADYLLRLGDGLESTAAGSTPMETSTVNFRDPIGNETEVSYYYTAAVTGSAAWTDRFARRPPRTIPMPLSHLAEAAPEAHLTLPLPDSTRWVLQV